MAGFFHPNNASNTNLCSALLDCVRGNNVVFDLFLPVVLLGPIEDNDGD